MPITWPAALPQSPLLGWGEEVGETKVRTPTDAGPARVRRRFTASVDLMEWPLALTEAQYTALETFYKTTTADGSLRFDITHPRKGTLVEVRFLGKLPQFVNASPNLYRGTLVFEIMPQ